MRSRDDAVPAGAAVERALTLGLCGIGERPGARTWSARRPAHDAEERRDRRIARFSAAPDGSFVWTRDVDGLLWLGRMTGAVRRDTASEAKAVDLVHVRPCEWLPRPVDPQRVPPAVRATFARGGRNWQQIHDPDVSALSARLWEQRGSDPR
jgi:hypothetical protein